MNQRAASRFGIARGRVRRWSRAARFAALLLSLPAAADSSPTREPDVELRKVQAALLYKFYFYINGLPSQALAEEHPFRIGILGDDPFGECLDPMRELRARGHPVRIRQADTVEELAECEVIFISDSEQERLDEIMRAVDGQPRVLVSDIEGFVDLGGTIGFVIVDGTVGFEINQRVARDTQLRLSSRLLRLAEKVVR